MPASVSGQLLPLDELMGREGVGWQGRQVSLDRDIRLPSALWITKEQGRGVSWQARASSAEKQTEGCTSDA